MTLKRINLIPIIVDGDFKTGKMKEMICFGELLKLDAMTVHRTKNVVSPLCRENIRT
jgi:hypothetical protein